MPSRNEQGVAATSQKLVKTDALHRLNPSATQTRHGESVRALYERVCLAGQAAGGAKRDVAY